MDFKKACKFYVTNYTRLKDKQQARRLLAQSYQLLQYKRRKLKTGSTTFVFKQLFYGEWLISQWFEMEFTSQESPYELRKKVERTLQLLDWAWDFKNLLLAGIIGVTLFNYVTSHIEDYYNYFIAGDLEEKVVRLGLKSVFSMIEPRLFRVKQVPDFIYESTSALVDVAMVFDLF